MEVIDKSIQKWKDILSGSAPLNNGRLLCELCFKHYQGMPCDGCPRCPLSKVGAHCLDNPKAPWGTFRRLLNCYKVGKECTLVEQALTENERNEFRAAAQRMLDALHKAKEWEGGAKKQ